MGQQPSSSAPLAETFDLSQYLGKWHEIARFPIRWETKCFKAIAEYSQGYDKYSMKVRNVCFLDDDKTPFSRSGIASRTDKELDKTHLQLEFTDGLPSDGLSDYWVLDTDYKHYALVGNKDKSKAWILSRQPMMSRCVYNALVNKLHQTFGYDVSKLILHDNVLTQCM